MMAKNILFRCDLGPRTGMGHFRRCLVLARELESEGMRVRWRIGLEEGRGCPDLPETAEVDFVEVNREDEWDRLRKAAKDADLVVIDQYELAAQADEAASFLWMRFDAGLRTKTTTAGIVHNAIPGTREEDYAARLRRKDALVLARPEHALLDDSFTALRLSMDAREEWPVREGVKRLLLLFGGGCDRGATLAFLNELDEVWPEGTRVIATTSKNPALPELRHRAQKDKSIELRVDETEMAVLMAGADAAISAGGTTLNELACMGVPAWVVAIAENQERPALCWEVARTIRYGGRFPEEFAERRAGLGLFLEDRKGHQTMSRVGRGLVDGKGARRTARRVAEFLSGRS